MSQTKLLRDKRFSPLFWTQFFGAFNDNFMKNAIVLLITFKGGEVFGFSPAEMVAVSGGIFILPYFLFSAVAGQIADKFEKTRVIRVVKACEIAIMFVAAGGFALGHFPLLLGALFAMGIHSTFFGPVKYSILPQHMHEDELVGANALIEAGTFLAILLGTIGGGISINLNGGPLIVSALLVIVAVVGYLFSLRIVLSPAADPTLSVQWDLVRPTIKILRVTASNHTVWLSILGASWFWFFGASMLALFRTYAKDTLHAHESVVTALLASFSLGIGLGSLLCEKLSKGRIELGLVPFGSIGISIFTLDLWWNGAALSARVCIDLVLIAMFSGFFIVPLYAMIQERSDAAVRSRVIAGNNIVNAVFMVVSAVFLTLLERAGSSVPTMFAIFAVMNALVAVYIYTLVPEFLLRFCAWILTNIMYRLQVTGEEHIPAKGGAVVIVNHVSFVDWLIMSAAVRRPMVFVMHYSYHRGFLSRRLMKRMKVVPIASAKEKPELLARAMEIIADRLRNGDVVCLFPEGTITRDGELSSFKPGLERIVAATPVPVIPAALDGMWGSWFSRARGRAMKGLPSRFRHTITVDFAAPVAPSDVHVEELRKKIGDML